MKTKLSKYITIAEAIKQGSGEVSIRGWVYRQRKSNKFVFCTVRDESTEIIQCIVKKDNDPDLYEEAAKLTIESSVQLSGTIKEDERAPSGFEIQLNNLDIVQIAEPFPITRDVSTEFLLDQRHVSIRSRRISWICGSVYFLNRITSF